ncbi:MAG TPA: dipeptidase PepE [Candidatus Onthomorpha intestinigallinarum]|uniref:Dipeptidase PepE n=1 Tax=Candidatus Onthomorpha intestinigallinarum TaxID=2840880 RepID=A0A9D1RIV3_9BACT|nr:dipeptidase PepE [Candidatus Onthomorpha intestinigallinarum]
MKRNLLLISNSTNRGEEYLGWCRDMIRDFCNESGVKDVLFIPYAGVSMGYDNYETKVKSVFEGIGLNLHSIHREKDAVTAVRNAECIAVGGGNTFHLVYELYRNGIMEEISSRAKDGMAYMGWSAGSNVAGPSLKTTNDMPIIEPESFDCMNLVPFQINPHYTDFFDPKHGGETRDDRLNEFIKVNPQMWVAGIREATALRLKEGRLSLTGRNNKMKVFRYRQEPKEYSLEDDINFLMR